MDASYSDRAIGVFDSGIGGLTVVHAIRSLLPNEDIRYIGDLARVPYGGKSRESIIAYSSQLSNYLVGQFDVKAIVVACNSASATAFQSISEEFPGRVHIDVINPSASAAVKISPGGRIGVIGTKATINSGAYAAALHGIDSNIHVHCNASPLLVPLIEENWVSDPLAAEVAERYLEPLIAADIDTLILGCTHYPLMKQAISKLVPDLQLVDSATATAEALREALSGAGLARQPDLPTGRTELLFTDECDSFYNTALDQLALDVDQVTRMDPF